MTPAPPEIGSTVGGRYRLLGELGRGATSIVYLAEDGCGEHGEIALKVAVGDPLEDRVRLLEREARLLRRAADGTVVRCFDFGFEGATGFLALERLQGRLLNHRLREVPDRRLPWDEAASLLRRFAGALEAVHCAGVVHGDFKPGAMFLTSDGGVKLIDFGAAREIGETGLSCASSGGGQLQAFTPLYASPEALRGEPASPSDDVYSYAVVAYALLTGRHPYGGLDAEEALEAGDAEPSPMRGMAPRGEEALRRGLALRRERRPASVLQLADALLGPTAPVVGWRRSIAGPDSSLTAKS